MEASSCVKAVIVAANQYLNNSTDSHLVHLQRQLDVLISVTAKGSLLTYFEPSELLATQCLTCLVDILNDSQVKPSLAQKVMLLLSNLADEEVIRNALHKTFHLTSCLASYLRCNMTTPSDPIIIQCVKLLQRITYNCRISYQETYLDDFIKFIIKHIQPKENELTQHCLGVMANLTRHSFSVQTHVKNMENVKSFYKSLMKFLSHPNQKTVIFTLSILSCLCLHEELGEMLFNAQNIHQTFQLMFNILVNGDSATTRMYAVDLFKDILHQPRIQHSLTRYEHLEQCISQVLHLVGKVQEQSVSKIFDLLLSFCSVNGIRCIVCRSLLTSRSLQDPARYQELLATPDAHRSEPFFAILHLAAQSVDTHDNAPLLALEFLKEIYQEVIDLGLLGQVNPRVEAVLPIVTEALMTPLDTTGPAAVRHCLRAVRALQLLITLSSDESLQAQAAAAFDSNICASLIEHQLDHNRIAISQTQNARDPDDWSEVGVEIVLYGLDLMSRFRRHVPQLESRLDELLQDQRLVPFLAFAMRSENRDHVQVALKLITRGSNLPGFPTIVLGESIAANNANSSKRADDKELNIEDTSPPSPKRFAWSLNDNKENVPVHKSLNTKYCTSRSELDSSVDQLIEKMQTGMELKDVRASEIINVYEHKLQSLETKENHLQDLLEAKALALAQADRLIAQYRCRRAQADAEAQKLRSLLRESERRAEEQREKRHDAESERDRLSAEVEQASADLSRLEAVAADYQDLSQAHREQTQRLENVQRTLGTLKQEHQTMTEMHEMLRRHNETLKQQHDLATEQLSELEEQRKNLTRLVKEKETKENELSKSLSKTEDRLKKVTKDRDDQEKAVDKLRVELSKTEKAKKQLQHQVSTLEVVCQQHEDAIQDKDATIHEQKTELEKHAQIAALIHNLSSGGAPQNNS